MNEALHSFLTELAIQLAMILLPILFAALTTFVVAKVKEVLAQIKAEKPQVLDVLDQIAHRAVKAAEQAHLAGYIEDKKTYAISVIEASLKAAGYDVDIDPLIEAIEAAIEAAVHDEFNSPQARALG